MPPCRRAYSGKPWRARRIAGCRLCFNDSLPYLRARYSNAAGSPGMAAAKGPEIDASSMGLPALSRYMSRDMYLDKAGNPIEDASISGPLAAAIPGEPAAFEYLARKYGKLSLKQSLQPAIRLARQGFPLYARLQGGIRYKQKVLLRSPDAAKAFLTADGGVPDVGAVIKQPDLANTLEARTPATRS